MYERQQQIQAELSFTQILQNTNVKLQKKTFCLLHSMETFYKELGRQDNENYNR